MKPQNLEMFLRSRHLMNSDASSAGDVPDKLSQFSFTSCCIPKGVTYGCAGLVVVLLIILLAVCWTCKRKTAELKRKNTQLQNEYQDDMDQMVTTLQQQKRGLEETRDQLTTQLEKLQTEKEENKKQLQSVEEEITEREKTFDKPQTLITEKEKLLQAQ